MRNVWQVVRVVGDHIEGALVDEHSGRRPIVGEEVDELCLPSVVGLAFLLLVADWVARHVREPDDVVRRDDVVAEERVSAEH
jgi:hypothetical protein